MSKKIDKEGRYLPFPGYTVVANVYDLNQTFFDELYLRLQNSTLISRHYSLLPKDSYHITTFSIFARKTMSDHDWQHWIHSHSKSRLRPCHDMIKETLTPFHFRIKQCSPRRLHFQVEVDEANTEKHHQVARDTGYEDGIQHCGFHITLGYQFLDFPVDLTKSKNQQKVQTNAFLEQVTAEVNHLVQELLHLVKEREHHDDDWMSAAQPQLCFYHDMTKFIPWDGESNPFYPDHHDGQQLSKRRQEKSNHINRSSKQPEELMTADEMIDAVQDSNKVEVLDDEEDDLFDRS